MDVVKSFKGLSNWTDFENSQVDLSSKEKGDRFEYITKLYFQLHHKYSTWIKDVWLSHELDTQIKKKLSLDGDIGFDLILRDKLGNYIPVQCKYHSDRSRNVGWKEASTFFGLYNSSEEYQTAYLCSNAYGVSSNFESVNSKPIYRILGLDWSRLDSDFFSLVQQELFGAKAVVEPYSPLPHQSKAISDALTYFNKQKHTRGKLIFPCGSGKSLTGYWLTRDLKSQTTLIAVPSLSLVKQTLDVYLRETVANGLNVEWLCICSDTDIGKSAEVKYSTEDLGIPSTTDPDKIKQWLTDTSGKDRFVFTTYQSGQIIAEVSKSMDLSFDLGIFDEAHKTVGKSGKLFSYLLHANNINIDKRVFMTATERFYHGAREDIVSMDDTSVYGQVFSKMSFKDAIDGDLLTDYKIITIDVQREEIAEFIKKNGLVHLDPAYGKDTEARSLASMIALRKAMQLLPIKNAVSFHSTIDKARRAVSIQEMISHEYSFDSIDAFTVSGKHSVAKRELTINEFADSDNALITNARCLTEGVDVPKIDCIVFSDPKKSKVDIVQALGRALRKKKGKDYGYVVLPVIYDGVTHEIDADNYKEIVDVVRGLAANDGRIIEYFSEKKSLNIGSDNNKHFEPNDLSEFILMSDEFKNQITLNIWESLSRFQWRSFHDATKYVNSLGLKSVKEYKDFARSQNRPLDIPIKPESVYANDWNGYKSWLGTAFLTFNEAREWVQKLNLKSAVEWDNYIESGQLPVFIPKYPRGQYPNDWLGLKDWLGYEFLIYADARDFVQRLGLRSYKQWEQYKQSGLKPKHIPALPELAYEEDWKGYKEWLGYSFLNYDEAKMMVNSWKLNSQKDWRRFIEEGHLPINIPSAPRGHYLNIGWTNWGDWLGHRRISDNERHDNYMDFESARAIVHTWGIKSVTQWHSFAKSDKGKRPDTIPFKPERTYEGHGWDGYGDWLGTGVLGSTNRTFRSFAEMKKFAISLGLSSKNSWFEYWKNNKRPSDVPSNPRRTYLDKGWVDWGDFLGFK